MSIVCPICRAPLSITEKMYSCEQNHSYDIAKEGYVNLLPVQKKNSKNPGDSKDMINARRAFLEKGYYDPLVNQLIPIFDKSTNTMLLDAGCGEGFYSGCISQQVQCLDIIGFDISKEAIKKAAKKYKSHQFYVSSVNDIPISEKSLDYILTVFAPINENEFNKVLKDDGKLIIVSAGPNHMREIAELIYDEFKPHNYNPLDSLSSHFQIDKSRNESYTISIELQEDRLNLLKMTPYYWSTNEKNLMKILESGPISITCEFNIQVYSKIK